MSKDIVQSELEKIYIHYGSPVFRPEWFRPARNRGILSKPADGTGLWASAVDDEFGWKDWCEIEEFRECDDENAFRFRLTPSCNLCVLEHPRQLERLPLLEPYEYVEKKLPPNAEEWRSLSEEARLAFYERPDPAILDFEQMRKDGIDAIRLLNSGAFRDALCIWDCDCLYVMNADVIIPC